MLTTGAWPAMAPAPRDWANHGVKLEIPSFKLDWPPPGWQQITPEVRQEAHQMLSYILSFTDASKVPTESPAVVAERYGAFMLPGQSPAPVP